MRESVTGYLRECAIRLVAAACCLLHRDPAYQSQPRTRAFMARDLVAFTATEKSRHLVALVLGDDCWPRDTGERWAPPADDRPI